MVERKPNGLLPYGPPLTGPTGSDPVVAAAALLHDGFQSPRHRAVPIAGPVPWDGGGDRAFARRLHSWLPIEPPLQANDVDPVGPHLDAAIGYADAWIDHEQAGGDAMSWYDLAAGQRALRLAYLADALRHRSEGSVPDRFLRLIDDHAGRLMDDDSYAGHSNHGLFQVAGMLALGRRFPERRDCARVASLGRSRLTDLIDAQFAADGVHREHSPGYHEIMLRTLTALMQGGIVDLPGLPELRARSEEALAWFVTPDGRLARFGDTHARPLSRAFAGGRIDAAAIVARWSHPALQFAVSAGQLGAAPETTTRAFVDGGYAVLRTPWIRTGSGDTPAHLAMTAAFHSRTHKHADDLSITWFDAGRPLLVDAGTYGYVGGRVEPSSAEGRRGYWYDNPNRMYCESTPAHNTVVIDGTDHDRLREPYGSGIRVAGEVGGEPAWQYAIGSVAHGAVVHHRAVIAALNGWLLVVDDLMDASGDRHRYEQRFHAAPDLHARLVNESVELAADVPVMWAASARPGSPLSPVRGDEGPPLQGWHSPGPREMVPAWAFGWSHDATAAGLATQFSLFGPIPLPTVERDENHRLRVGICANGVSAEITVDFEDAAAVQRVG